MNDYVLMLTLSGEFVNVPVSEVEAYKNDWAWIVV